MEDEKAITEVLAHSIGPKDAALCHLALCANYGVGTEVTIVVGGQLITGELVSGKEYAETTANAFRNANCDDSLKESLAGFFEELANDYSQEEGNTIPLNYVHLKDPAYLRGDGVWLTIKGAILRVHLEKVLGFTLGRSCEK
ncbi:TPA: hypothetical protein NO705_000878 [Klebsiella pneumoniae]|nr:hypothetical protein [Klebsiella pneumoniae]HCI4441571.1 hypothetical protein [Klebsiella pneumoniae]HDS5147868.1 hypothetical protein [Klebsiella pneumoniae subsp. pneumoniae]